MGRPKKSGKRIAINRKLPLELWERLQHYAASHTPRFTDTAILEAAIIEYLERHETKESGGDQ